MPRPIPQTYIVVFRSLPKLYINKFTVCHGVGCGEIVLYGNNAPSFDLLRPNAYRGCAASRLFNMRAEKMETNHMISGSCCARGSGGGILSKCGAGPRSVTGPSLTGGKLLRPGDSLRNLSSNSLTAVSESPCLQCRQSSPDRHQPGHGFRGGDCPRPSHTMFTSESSA